MKNLIYMLKFHFQLFIYYFSFIIFVVLIFILIPNESLNLCNLLAVLSYSDTNTSYSGFCSYCKDTLAPYFRKERQRIW